jgi:hypothetical protein
MLQGSSVCKFRVIRNEVAKVLQTSFSFPKVVNSLTEYSMSR